MNGLLGSAWLCLLLATAQGAGSQAGPAPSSAAAADRPVYDDEIQVVSWEDLRYPPVALSARMEGTVVVSATLTTTGAVAGATALSGTRILIAPVLENIKRWTFTPNTLRKVIIIYDFRIDGACNSNGHSLFRFKAPNVVSIMACTTKL